MWNSWRRGACHEDKAAFSPPSPRTPALILLSHLTGSPNSRHAALAYHEAGLLRACHHNLAWTDPPGLPALLPGALRAALRRRQFPAVLAPRLRTHPLPEWARLVAARLRLPLLAPLARRLCSIQASNRRFDRAVARSLGGSGCQAVHGYFDTSLHTFREARRLGLRRIYELPTPYWRTVRRVTEAERARRPGSDWNATLPSADSLAASAAQRDEELQLADLILVPSAFVRDSLAEAPAFQAPVVVIPYGCPDLAPPLTTGDSPRLRLLFAGTLSQSKGLADLLEAIEPLGDRVSLTLAGSASGPLPAGLRHPGAQVRRAGQLPHGDLLQEMRGHDLLVLPTLYEGLSLVALEAMSQGLPVLTTTCSGLDGLIENGRHARLVPPADPAALRAEIESLLSQPEARRSLAEQARDWAREHSWQRYGTSLVNACRSAAVPSPQ